MNALPSVTGKELIAALAKAGFNVARIKGSHHFLRHSDGRSTVVPVHSGETMAPDFSRKSCAIANWTEQSFKASCEQDTVAALAIQQGGLGLLDLLVESR